MTDDKSVQLLMNASINGDAMAIADHNHGDRSSKRNRSSIERSNLTLLMKLIVKELIENSLKSCRTVDSQNVSLIHFFIVFENILKHGLKNKKGLLAVKKELWHVLELVERLSPDASDITLSVKQLPTVRTLIGRSRAWIRLALMKKTLSDYFRILIDSRDECLKEFYDESALMMSEEAVVISGLLVGLNILDCNLCVKEEDLDYQHSVIDFSYYLRDNVQQNYKSDSSDEEPSTDNKTLTEVLDQKNYVEELNRHLSATIANLELRIKSLQSGNRRSHSSSVESRNAFNESLSEMNVKEKQIQDNSINEENNELVSLNEKLANEIVNRHKIEKELEAQIHLKSEAETAMHLLERDVMEKQDTIVTFRRQLEDTKAINLQMYNKLQECDTTINDKNDHISHLEDKICIMANTISQLETKVVQFEKRRIKIEENSQKLNDQLSDGEQKRLTYERDLKSERERRSTLQKLVDEQQEQITALLTEIESLKSAANEIQRLRAINVKFEKKCRDYELSLEEIGARLQDAKLEVDFLRENNGRMKEAVWTNDKEVNNCKQCDKHFSMSRRKHHCRHCGEIFCNSCSNNEMPLPSNKKPVRVCDSCHTLLLERYSAT